MAQDSAKNASEGSSPENKNAEPNNASSDNANRRKWWLLGLTVVFVIVGLAYACYYVLIAQFYVTTDDAYVHGDRAMLTPQIPGTVTAIYADDTDRVKAGQPMIELDRSDKRVAFEHAKAQLASSVRQVRQLYAQTAEQKAMVAMRHTQLQQAQRDYKRDHALVKVKGVSRKQYQKTRLQLHAAQAELQQAQHKLEGLQAITEHTDLHHHPKVAQAASALEAAYLNLQRTRIVAPISGYVAQRHVQLGEKVAPGKPMLAIVPLENVWVEANFKETELPDMRISQPVTITADVYGDDVTYHGKIAGISAGSGSVFELLPPQNATGNWIKVVQRVPVRITLDPDELAKHPLRLGLSLHASVDIHNTSGPVLAAKPRSKPALTTAVYRQRKNDAQALIEQVIDANDGVDNTPVKAQASISRLEDTTGKSAQSDQEQSSNNGR